jgi:hypothetical protein
MHNIELALIHRLRRYYPWLQKIKELGNEENNNKKLLVRVESEDIGRVQCQAFREGNEH